MNNADWNIIVIGSDDRRFSKIEEALQENFSEAKVACVHAPINGNTLVTTNGLGDNLKDCEKKFVALIREDSVDHPEVITEAITQFEKGGAEELKPILRRRRGAKEYEWCSTYDLACEIAVAKCADLFSALFEHRPDNSENGVTA